MGKTELEGLPARYAVLNELHSTNMSHTYVGKDLETNQTIVVKHCNQAKDFFREVVASVKLFSNKDQEHIVPILAAYSDRNYLVMPFIEGGNLFQLQRLKKGLTLEETVNVAAQIGQALEEVHAAKIIHNDIKSGNVLLTYGKGKKVFSNSIAKLTDFGLSFSEVCEPNFGSGTKPYMAPELFSGVDRPTTVSDIYSFGLMIHELLTNFLLYEDDNKKREEIPAHPRIPETVLPVLRKACHPDPSKRYESVSAFVHALNEGKAEVEQETLKAKAS